MFLSFSATSATCLLGLTLLFSSPFTTQDSANQAVLKLDAGNQRVSVIPEAATAVERIANTGGHVVTFAVRNTGTDTDTYDLSCVGVARVECGGAIPTRLTLNAGQEATVDVSYEVSGAGAGLVSLIAFSPATHARDRGSYLVSVTR